jgi:DNA helicase-2/ATP-dependent DNA helicase PcrA
MQSTKYDQLTPSQKKAVFHVEGPLLVIAGPGSGKTRVITYRIAALIDAGVKPRNICAITFTNKAAQEMLNRTIALDTPAGPHISTFHSLCVRILRIYAERAGINSNFSIFDDNDQTRCMKQALADCELDTTQYPPARMLEAVSVLKNKLIDADSFKAGAGDFFDKTLAKVYSHYETILAENNALDFDDLLLKAAFLLEKNTDVCSSLSNRFKFLLIDEYQDTNHAQYRIAKALVSQHNNICATGDPDQSIYRWRGADIRNILDFETDWPDAVIIKLEENFRSTPNILEVADNLIAANTGRKQKRLIPVRPRGADIAITIFEDEAKEAYGVAQRVKELTEQGASPNSIAVFYRVNAASRTLEEAFIHNKIPYQIVRGVAFYGRKEIRDMLAYLKILVNPRDEVALLRIINTPHRGIGKTTIDKIRAYAASGHLILYDTLKKGQNIDSLSKAHKAKLAVFIDQIEHFKKDIGGKVGPLVERVFVESGLQKSLKNAKDTNALENVDELINAAHIYDKQAEQPSLLDYLQQIALFTDADSYDASKGAVALMTLHCAKGLEFENVFIIGLEDGILPHERTNAHIDPDQLEEERRLFFVGITRAKTRLHISLAHTRKIRGQTLRSMPSEFLYELGLNFPQSAEKDFSYNSATSSTFRSSLSKDLSNYDESGFDESDFDEAHFNGKNPHFIAGQRVRHDSFGLGTVKKFLDMGEDSIVVVQFSSGHTKSIMLKYTNLTKV